ncbi:hypothetical protein GCK32_021621 [Trichostrongylus colubriformis]|uniref:Peptidase A2 domain-containing protein n=1 Tax=Trichostrongylus colubriformis TaxID=6319 RepID=A0AAN8FDF3_TRICO
MVGPIQLKSQKGLLTRYSNILSQVVTKYNDKLEEEQSQRFLAEITTEINANLKIVEDTLENFTRSADQIRLDGAKLSSEQESEIEDYVERTHELLERAQKLSTALQAKMAGLYKPSRALSEAAELQSAKVELPVIPIPTFSGKISDFENFWALFSANVHSQKLSNLQKFNYLLRSLRGEAKEAVKRYPVTEENYDAAVEVLQTKFGNKSKIIYDLQVRLERAKASGTHICEQRKLLEYLIALSTQLEQKGVSLNGSFISQKILAKFRQDLQRKVLQQRVEADHKEDDWSTNKLLGDLDKLITAEEKVDEKLRNSESRQNRSRIDSAPKQFENSSHPYSPCIYCNTMDHSSQRCTKVATIKERTQFLLKNGRCLNCTRSNHFLKDCTKKECNMCAGKKHHSSICPKRQNKGNDQQNTDHSQPANKSKRTKQDTGKPSPRQNYIVSMDQQDLEGSATSTLHISNVKNTNEVLLLTGTAKVHDKRTKMLKEVEILLDTGADRSFILNQLADELKLPRTNTVELSVYTFGNKTPRHQKCEITELQIWDAQGDSHTLSLHKTDVISAKAKQILLTPEDVEYLHREEIALAQNTRTPVNPQILLGCDQLWPLLHTMNPQHTLPSGLFVIPSKLGYLLSGRQVIPEQRKPATTRNNDSSDKGNGIHDNPQSTLINTLDAEEIEQWDRYWSLDTGGIEEFTDMYHDENRSPKRELKRIKSALPPLPSPAELYDDIVINCQHVMHIVELVDSLKLDVRVFNDRSLPFRESERDARILELKTENCKVRLQFHLKHLRLLYSTVPLLIATKAVSAQAWQAKMELPQAYTSRSGERKTLLIDQMAMERILKDQLRGIEEFFNTLRQLRTDCLTRERAQQQSMHSKILNAIQSIDDSMAEMRSNVEQIASGQKRETPSMVSVAIEAKPEGEEAIIAANAEFMEAVG